MKKYNISRKNKTHKKYNNTLFRRINKHFNLTRTMKGGVKEVKTFIQQLENLLENINNDKTFDPLGSPIYTNIIKDDDIKHVTDALASLRANRKITDATRQSLKNYIYHYTDKTQHEKEKEYEYLTNDLSPYSLYNSTDIKRAQAEYLQQLQIIQEKPLWGKWLEKYIKLLSNYEYFNSVQEQRIYNQLTTIIVAANARNASNASNASNAMENVEHAMKIVENESIANIERLRDERNEKRQAMAAETAHVLPLPQNLPPPGAKKGGKTKRIIKRNVKSKKKKRRNRY